MDTRLDRRYEIMVRAHMQSGSEIAAGVKSVLNQDVAFSQTQAAWRFLNNENCTLDALSQPLLKAAHELSEQECDNYMLIAHDWSHLFYGHHNSKKDTYNTFKKSVGYELHSSLALSDRHGGPLAPVAMNLKTKTEVFSSYHDELKGLTHLEELSLRIECIEQQDFRKELVHIVDREGDSVALFRALGEHNWLIRANGNNYAEDGKSYKKLKHIAEGLSYTETRTIEYKGKPAKQLIAEKEVIITRAAHPKKTDSEGKRKSIKGAPVKVRLIVSRVVDADGNELAIWYLLSNMQDVSAATLALWYYWRWSIESFFKLLKSAGMQLESWQQTTGISIARRLLVASMACVYVWRIGHATGPQAGELRKVLVRLSGRQMKWKVEFTYNALFAGLYALLSIEELLTHYSIDELKGLASQVFGGRAFV